MWVVKFFLSSSGHKPLPADMAGSSSRATLYSSYNQSPLSATFESPILSYQVSPSTIFPFLSNAPIPSSLRFSNSAPVTPPLSSPTSKLLTWDSVTKQSMANAAKQSPSSFHYPVSAPASPTHHRHFSAPATIPECDESDSSTVDSGHWISFQKFAQQPFHAKTALLPISPTFSLVKPAPPNTAATPEFSQSSEFKFENSQVKPWEGERIHDVAMEDLELSLGNAKARS